jgi:hypothetical protein
MPDGICCEALFFFLLPENVCYGSIVIATTK